jgi:hypothetical protein
MKIYFILYYTVSSLLKTQEGICWVRANYIVIHLVINNQVVCS